MQPNIGLSPTTQLRVANSQSPLRSARMPPIRTSLTDLPTTSPLPATSVSAAGSQLLAAITGTDVAPQDVSTVPRRETSVRQSFAYRIRLPLTTACVVSGVLLALRTAPYYAPRSAGGIAVAVVGALLIVAGIVVRLWALGSISERKTRQLVTTGPYSLCRNPLYVGTLFIVAGFVVMWQSVMLAVFLVPPVLLYLYGVVPVEERVLRGRYGVEFDAYCRHTPRWIPRLSGYVREDRVTWWSVGVVKEAQCGLWWIGFAALTLWVSDLREGWFGFLR